MTVKKINGTTFSVDGVKYGIKNNQIKLTASGNFLPIEMALALLNKGEARKLRKALRSLGHTKLASTKRNAA